MAALTVQCPVCMQELPAAAINAHLDRCLQLPEAKRPRSDPDPDPEALGPGSPPAWEEEAGEEEAQAEEPQAQPGHPQWPPELRQRLEARPLADAMRPDSLRDYRGQDRALGRDTLLRSLLEAHDVPSLLLWGPPGCGKVGTGCRGCRGEVAIP